ncbi:MAG: hypothetical protein HY302_16990 [Opitutae bacterium]|nr:hypothetical protein [Opitutae bacterium]
MPPAPRLLHSRALLGLVLCNALWALSFPLVKGIVFAHAQVLPGSGSWFVTACVIAPRFVLATAVLALILGRGLADLRRSEIKQGLLIGLAASGGMLFQNDGLQFTSASTSAFLTQFSAIMIPLWLAWRHRRWPSPVVWLCCGLVLAGTGVLAGFDPRTMRLGRGELETLVSSFFFMLQIFALDRQDGAGNRVLPVTITMFATEAVIFTAMSFATAPHAADVFVPWTSPVWVGCTLALTVFCTLGAFTLMNKWQPFITPTEAGLIYCLEPVFTAALALFLPGLLSGWGGFDYPNETATFALLVGGGLITAANALIQLRTQVSPPQAA